MAGPAKDSIQRAEANECVLVIPPAERDQAGGRRWAKRGDWSRWGPRAAEWVGAPEGCAELVTGRRPRRSGLVEAM